jgi:transposase
MEVLVPNAALVALDWGDQQHAFALQMADANTSEAGQINSSPEAFHQWLAQLRQRCNGRPVALAVEAGRPPVLHVLQEHPWVEVYLVNPATSAWFRKAFAPSGAKDDIPDAEVLLTLLMRHRDRLARWRPDGPLTQEIAALVAARRNLVGQRTRLSNQLRYLLKSYFPQALELTGQDLFTKLSLDFLERWPELTSLQRARRETVRQFYLQHNVRASEVIDQRLEFIAAARVLTTNQAVITPAVLQVQGLIAQLRLFQQQVQAFEERIEKVFATHPEAAFFRALPGAGPTFAPRLLVAFGDDRQRYPDPASMQKHFGVAPVMEKSGNQSWTHWRLNAPVFLRQTFVEWAGSTVVYCDWAHAFYLQQKQAGKHRQAILRALAFKWIRILWRCWQNRTPYNNELYCAALSRRGSPLATAMAYA